MNTNMNMNKMLKKVDRNMVENVVIFVLLVVILGLLVKHYLNRKNENFSAQNGEEPRLVLYYAPWCPHCTGFREEWKKLGDSQEVNGVKIQVEQIDCQENADVAEKENIEGFPTVKLHSANGAKEYQGERTSDAVVLWLQKNN